MGFHLTLNTAPHKLVRPTGAEHVCMSAISVLIWMQWNALPSILFPHPQCWKPMWHSVFSISTIQTRITKPTHSYLVNKPALDQPLTPRSSRLSAEYTGSKDPDAGKDWGQEEKGTTEDEMVGWHHWLNGHEFEHAPEDGEAPPSMLQSLGSPRVGHAWGMEQQQMI